MSERSRRKEARPREIIEAAFQIFVRDGYAGTRLEDVATLAQVTKGTIYVYFENKESLFAAMVRELSQHTFKTTLLTLDHCKTTKTEQLRQHFHAIYDVLASDPHMNEILRLLIAESPRFPDLLHEHFQEFIEPAHANIRRIVDAGVAAGEFNPSAVTRCHDILIAPALAYAIMNLVFARQLSFETSDYRDAHIRMAIAALSAG